ncbi:hypothetical protein Tco_0497825, partial [Tanacetum coccineum]
MPQIAAPAPRTAAHRLQRLEEKVQQIRQRLSQQRKMIERLTTKHARYSSWMVDHMIELIDERGMRYQRLMESCR